MTRECLKFTLSATTLSETSSTHSHEAVKGYHNSIELRSVKTKMIATIIDSLNMAFKSLDALDFQRTTLQTLTNTSNTRPTPKNYKLLTLHTPDF